MGAMPDPHVVDLASTALVPRRSAPKPPTKEQGLPGPVNSGFPTIGALGVAGTMGDSYFLDSREYAADLRWNGAYTGSTLVYSRMETDAQLTGLMIVMSLPVRRFRWELDPNGARSRLVDALADDLGLPVRGKEEATRRRPSGYFRHDRHIAHALRALIFGHYHFEETYEYREDGLLHLAKLGTRPPTSIQNFLVDDHGEFAGIEQVPALRGVLTSLAQGFIAEPIPSTAILPYVWNPADDGDVVGRSMLRASYKNWLAKDALIRIDVVKNERNGMGMPWFEVDPAASDDQIQALAAIAQSIRAGEQGGAAGPGKLNLVGTTGSVPDTIGSIRYHDQQMSRTFSAMWMDLGSSETGARALGETLMEATLEAQGAVADWYAECTQQMIDRWVLYNFGPDEQAPLISYTRLETSELAIKELTLGVEKGLIEVTPELRASIEDRWKVPGQRKAAEEQAEREQAEKEAQEAAGEDPRLPKQIPASTGEEGREEGDEAAEAEGGGEGVSASRKPARSVAAAAILEAMPPEGATWPAICRAAGLDRRNGTARRARAELLDAGAIVQGAGGTLRLALSKVTLPTGREVRRELMPFEVAAGVDFATMEQTWVAQRATLADVIREAQAPQIDELAAAAEAAAGDAASLSRISAKPIDAEVIADHLRATALAGVESARLEHANQVGQLPPEASHPIFAADGGDALERRVNDRAAATSQMLASGISLSAAGAATRATSLDAAGAGAAVRDHLEGLSGAFVEREAGGATTAAFNAGRMEYMRGSSPSAIYASELLDANTCSPCASEDGTEFNTVAESEADYPGGGYAACAGGDLCRGTVVAVY
jgi:hypothetical protein